MRGLFVLFVLGGSWAAAEEPRAPASRTWSDVTGQFKVEAALLGHDEREVRLRKSDGRLVTVPLDRLSAVDREFLKQASPVDSAPRFGKQLVFRHRFGLRVVAQGPCTGVTAIVPVPMDWPEQQVRILEERKSPSLKQIRYRTVSNGARQMLADIPVLRAGETAEAVVTCEITRHEVLPPSSTAELRLPTQLDATLRSYLTASPKIESEDRRIREKAAELWDESLPPWQRVERLYDWVRANVRHIEGNSHKGAIAALQEGGDCEEYTALFVALCRVNKVPARSIWIPRHTYPEFYLEDAQGRGHWYPCEALGHRAFGHVQRVAVILQKGDNFKTPEQAQRQHYAQATMIGNLGRSSGQPQLQLIDEPVVEN